MRGYDGASRRSSRWRVAGADRRLAEAAIPCRGVLKKELMAHLRTARQMRQAKGGTTKSGLGQIVDAVSIRAQPAEVEDRAVPGHWKDLLQAVLH